MFLVLSFFFKPKAAYVMRISDWSSDVCSSDLSHPDLAVDFALAHLPQVEKLVDTSSRSRYVARLAEGSRNVAMPSKLEAYAQQHLTPQSRKPIDQAIAKIQERIETRERIKSGVTAWLVTAVK